MKKGMARLILVALACVNSSAAISVASQPQASEMSVDAQRALVNQYCVGCHNDRVKSGDFSFATVDLAHPDQSAQRFEKVILKLKTGMMPPAGRPRPQPETIKSFTSALESEIDRAAASNPNPGRPYLHRLNRTEYANSIRSLLGLEIDAETLLPADTRSQGFDNMSEVLTVSPTLMEAYVRAGGKISRLAVGDAKMTPLVETYRMPTNFSQIRHVEGTPVGTRGGIAVVHNFPADAEYVFRMALVFTRNTFLFGSTMYGEQLEVAVNGERVATFDIDPLMTTGENDLRTPPIRVKAGPQKISASFVKKGDGPIEDFIYRPERSLGDDFSGQVPGLTNPPHLQSFGVMGPYNATGVSETASRKKIFICRPANENEEKPCATKILSALARQALRKPLTPEQVEGLMASYQDGRNTGGDFESGIRVGLQFILAHPEFVFRGERTPPNLAAGANYRITDVELASRLSYFLWSDAPDEELLRTAVQGKLKNPTVLANQVRRMLADPRSEALAKNFAGQWLHLRNLKELHPDVYLYPDSDDNLFRSMQRETELLFDSIVRENRNIADLMTANYTFVDERLAKHYGIPNVLGSEFRRVTLKDENRFGLLGQGSILSVTSFANRTSPVARGKWVLEQILGTAAPVPPPNVPVLDENNVNGGEPVKLRSVRERMEKHRTNEPCASCHKIMDPIGLALENFDAVGAWRTQDSGFPVDPASELVDGTKMVGPAGLRRALLKYSDAYVRTFIVKLLTYATGREFTYVDMPVVRQIEREAARDDNRLTSIVLGVVNSMPFQMRKVEQQIETNAGPIRKN
jgi:hypothetical protein